MNLNRCNIVALGGVGLGVAAAGSLLYRYFRNEDADGTALVAVLDRVDAKPRDVGRQFFGNKWYYRSDVREEWKEMVPEKIVEVGPADYKIEAWTLGETLTGPESILSGSGAFDAVQEGDLIPGVVGIGHLENDLFCSVGGGVRFYDLLISAAHTFLDPQYTMHSKMRQTALESRGGTVIVDLHKCERFTIPSVYKPKHHNATGFDIVAYRLPAGVWAKLGTKQNTRKSLSYASEGMSTVYGNPDGPWVKSAAALIPNGTLEANMGMMSFGGNTTKCFSGFPHAQRDNGAWRILGVHSCGDVYKMGCNHFVGAQSIDWILRKAGYAPAASFSKMLMSRLNLESKEKRRQAREWAAYVKWLAMTEEQRQMEEEAVEEINYQTQGSGYGYKGEEDYTPNRYQPPPLKGPSWHDSYQDLGNMWPNVRYDDNESRKRPVLTGQALQPYGSGPSAMAPSAPPQEFEVVEDEEVKEWTPAPTRRIVPPSAPPMPRLVGIPNCAASVASLGTTLRPGESRELEDVRAKFTPALSGGGDREPPRDDRLKRPPGLSSTKLDLHSERAFILEHCMFAKAKISKIKPWLDRVSADLDQVPEPRDMTPLSPEEDAKISSMFRSLDKVADFAKFKSIPYEQLIRSSFLRDYVRSHDAINVTFSKITKAGKAVTMKNKEGEDVFLRRAKVKNFSKKSTPCAALPEDFIALCKESGVDLTTADGESKYYWPPMGPEGSAESLRYQALEMNFKTMDPMSLNIETMHEAYESVPRYEMLGDKSGDLEKKFQKIFDAMDPTKSSGWSSKIRAGTKAAWLSTPAAREIFAYHITCRIALRASVGKEALGKMSPIDMVHKLLVDPRVLFTKGEAHSKKKFDTKAWRQIWICSGEDAGCQMLLCLDKNKADIAAYDDGINGSCVGLGHHDAGIKRLGQFFEWVSGAENLDVQTADASGYDLSVTRDAIIASYDARVYALDSENHAAIAELLYCEAMCNTAHVCLIGDELWECQKFGLTASGIPNTSEQNTATRRFLLKWAGASRAGSVGDDAAYSGSVDHKLLEACGVRTRDHHTHGVEGPHDFTSHKFTRDGSGWHAEFQNFHKMLAHLCFRSGDAPPSDDMVSGMLFALRHNEVETRQFKEIAGKLGWNLEVPLVPSEEYC